MAVTSADDDARRAGGDVDESTPRNVLIAYAAPSLTASLLFTAVGMYLLKFSTDVLLIPPATVGLVFGLSRLWDAVSDPVVGHLSDRTHTRLGRRRPWLLASALPVGVAYVALWSPPESLGSVGLVAWLAGSMLLFYTAMTTFGVPYTALGAELAKGYHDRTRLFGARAFADHAGIILSAAAILVLERSAAAHGQRETGLPEASRVAAPVGPLPGVRSAAFYSAGSGCSDESGSLRSGFGARSTRSIVSGSKSGPLP